MATKTIQKGRFSETIASGVVFVVCILSVLAIASWWQSNETAIETSAPEPEPENCEVYVLSVNVGDEPWVVLSNYETEPAGDGTVKVSTRSKNEFE